MEKGICKLLVNNDDRMMHYIMEDNRILILSLNDTEMIDEIKKGMDVLFTFEVKDEQYQPVTVKIVDDTTVVKDVFNKMLEANNTWFKEYDERLIVLELKTKK